jgi:hypothetical protein
VLVLERSSVFDYGESSQEVYREEGGKRMEEGLSSGTDKAIRRRVKICESKQWNECQLRPGGLVYKRYTFIVS